MKQFHFKAMLVSAIGITLNVSAATVRSEVSERAVKESAATAMTDIGTLPDTIKHVSYDGWTDEQIANYEDSLQKILYPIPHLVEIQPSELNCENAIVTSTASIQTTAATAYLPKTATLDKSKEVGDIAITSGTTPSGGRTYSIDVQSYQGQNGMNPNITLSYNSQSGTSVMGPGWSIGGVSSIERASKNIYYDGAASGVKMTKEDAFSLDGMRLLHRVNASSYAEFEAEFGKVKARGYFAGTQVISHFEVFYPDGKIGTFGYANATSNPVSYPLTKLVDMHGNNIQYDYTLSGNVYVLNKVTYNGCSIEFAYSTSRPDVIMRYIGGVKTTQDRLLSKVTCKIGTQTLGVYDLTYITRNAKSLLTTVSYTAGGKSYNPLRFYYGRGDVVSGYSSDTSSLARYFKYNESNPRSLNAISDRFSPSFGEIGAVVWPVSTPYWWTHKDGNLLSHTIDVFQNLYGKDQEIAVYPIIGKYGFSTDAKLLYTEEGFIDIISADLDGVERPYIVKINNAVSNKKDVMTFKVYEISATKDVVLKYTRTFQYGDALVDKADHYSVHPKYYYAGDFNGDGKEEILVVSVDNALNFKTKSECLLIDLSGNKILSRQSLLTYSIQFVGSASGEDPDAVRKAANNSDKLFPIDYDGDGKLDFCHINQSGTDIYTYYLGGFSKVGSIQGLTRTAVENRQVIPGDYNGDGLNDIAVSSRLSKDSDATKDVVWQMYTSKGDGSFFKSNFNGLTNMDYSNFGFMAQDVNGDGMTDLIKYDAAGFSSVLAKDNKLDGGSVRTTTDLTHGIILPTNKTSLTHFSQVLTINDDKITRFVFSRDDSEEVMVTAMVDSKGLIEQTNYTKIGYSPYGITEYYTEESKFSFPYANIRDQIPLVSKIETYCDGRMLNQHIIKYKNAVMHRQGRGFCGFEYILESQDDGSHCERKYAATNFGAMLEELTNQQKSKFTYSTSVDAFKVASINLTRKEVENLANGSKTVTDYTYDSYGYPIKEHTLFDDGIQSTTETTYGNGTTLGSNYSLGYPVDVQKTVVAGGDTYVERVQVSSYSKRQPLVVINYRNGKQVNRTAFAYDSKGNMTKKSMRPYAATADLDSLFTRDTYGRVTKVTDPMGLSTQYTFAANGTISKMTDARGNITEYKYDAFGRLMKETRPDNTIKDIKIWWTPNGPSALYGITVNETGKPGTSTSYDARNRVVRLSETAFNGSTIKRDRTYDKRSRLTSETLPYFGTTAAKSVTYEYDDYDRLKLVTEPSGKTISWAYDGTSVIELKDGVETTRDFDSQGNVISITDASGTVTYKYAADGQPMQVTAPGGVITKYTYDDYRRRASFVDPSIGTTSYKYDACGRIQSETDAAGKLTKYTYDEYGRTISEIKDDLTAWYTYTTYGELQRIASSNGSSFTRQFDDLGRMTAETRRCDDNGWLRRDYTYSGGNVATIRYTSAKGLDVTEKYAYTNGHFTEGTIGNSTPVFKLEKVNAFGKPTQVKSGKITRKYHYDEFGMPTGRSAVDGTTYRQRFGYDFDVLTGNLVSRTDSIRNLTENFEYDELNRLVSFGAQNVTYDAKGNILSRSDVGTFRYSNASLPYAVTDLTRATTAVPARQQDISYSTYHRPLSIVENGCTAMFTYDGEYDRLKMVLSKNGSVQMTKYYLADCYESETTSAGDVERLYLFGDFYSASAVYVKESGNVSVCNILRDYLGSITHVLSQSGTLKQELSYDAWGRFRNPANHIVYLPGNEPTPVLGRGYTGHEHLVQFGLVNMNARLYDPAVGRFLAPDPHVQDGENPQNFNRYSYALNNPLRYTDRDGEFIGTILSALWDTFSNLFKHGLNFGKYDWTKTRNAWKIDSGMFRGNFWQIVNKWTWGFMPNFFGNMVAQGYNLAGKVDNVTYLDGMAAISGCTSGQAAFTVGGYSMGPSGYVADWKNSLFVHEYGHYMQSQFLGPLYFNVVALPSLASAWFVDDLSGVKHHDRWFEVSASKLGAKHMEKKYGINSKYYREHPNDHYFDTKGFASGITPYYSYNPKGQWSSLTGDFYSIPHPISDEKITIWDFIF